MSFRVLILALAIITGLQPVMSFGADLDGGANVDGGGGNGGGGNGGGGGGGGGNGGGGGGGGNDRGGRRRKRGNDRPNRPMRDRGPRLPGFYNPGGD
jgi:hypothetical protein